MSVGWFGFSLLPLPTACPPACPTPGSHCNGHGADSCKDGASPVPSSGWRGPGRRPGLCSRRRPEKGRARPGVWLASATGAHWRAGRGAQPPSGALTGEHPAARPSQEQRCPHCSGCTGLRGAGFGPAAGGGRGRHTSPQTPVCVERVIRRWTVSTARGQLTPHRQSWDLGPGGRCADAPTGTEEGTAGPGPGRPREGTPARPGRRSAAIASSLSRVFLCWSTRDREREIHSCPRHAVKVSTTVVGHVDRKCEDGTPPVRSPSPEGPRPVAR